MRRSPSGSNTTLNEPLISLQAVGLTLDSRAGAVKILDGIDLVVREGETVAVVGPSGSGKTSLLMLIAGLEQATRGRITVAGHDFTALGEDALARARGGAIGIVFQSFHLVPTMTAIENVALPLEFRGQPDALASAAAVLGEVGLGHRLEHFPSQLSGGEQQRVALARALVPSPGLLLADEPTGNLDGATGRQVVDLLFAASARRNTSLVMVTHDEALARRCARVLRMADGKIVSDGAHAETPTGAAA